MKIFHTKDGKITKVPYTEHVPPDVTACIYWLKNRRPDRWRDVQRVDASLGHYILADRPLSIDEWIKERASVDKSVVDDAKTIEHEPKKS